MENYYNTCVDLHSSLEELKDLSDKPEIMDLFLTKLESVSKNSSLGTLIFQENLFTEKAYYIQLGLLFLDIVVAQWLEC